MNTDLKKIIESLRTLGYDDPAAHIRECWVDIVEAVVDERNAHPASLKLIGRIVDAAALSAEPKVEKGTGRG